MFVAAAGGELPLLSHALGGWKGGSLGAPARVSQIGCLLGEDKERQESLFLDCAFGQLFSAVAKILLVVAENPKYSRSERSR